MSRITDAFTYALTHCSTELGGHAISVEETLDAFTQLESTVPAPKEVEGR